MASTELALSHVAVFVLGLATCRWLTLWEGRKIAANRGETVPEPKRKPNRGRTLGVIILVASLFVAGLGWQQIRFQNQQADSAACAQNWGEDVTEVLDARSSANTKQSEAERARDNAADNIFLLFLELLTADPQLPKAEQKAKFNDALRNFTTAKAALDEQYKASAKTRVNNPYPTLDCFK